MDFRFYCSHFLIVLCMLITCLCQNQDMNKKENVSVNYYRGEFVMDFQGHIIESLKVKRAPKETIGEPWPLPQHYSASKNILYRINPEEFKIQIKNISCDILEKAILRYEKIIFESASGEFYNNLKHAGKSKTETERNYTTENYQSVTTIYSLIVVIKNPCAEYPRETSDESYSIDIEHKGAFLIADEVWGALRGLETFSQIVFTKKNEYYVKATTIRDFPRFRHRGILMDTARHYIEKDVILDVLEGMSQNKMNVLHWHIVDDQSFPYQSKVYPDLSEKGAYHPSKVYTHKDLEDIIEFAGYRGIRVMPEFDVPGHSYSWGLGYPELLAQCYRGGQPVPAFYGPMDPSKNSTYEFLNNHFKEVLGVFKDRYIHLGGDEVPMDCWQSNPEIMQFVSKTLSNKPKTIFPFKTTKRGKEAWKYFEDRYPSQPEMSDAWRYFTDRLTKDLVTIGQNRSEGIRMVMWEEVFRNKIPVPKDTVIQVWMGSVRELQRVTDSGHQAIYSTCWYIDHIPYGVHWPKYYQCDPGSIGAGFRGNEKMILGGEACLWSEFVTSETLISLLWPRASAVAERLWSSKNVIDINAAGPRLQEHRCRMLRRGLKVGYINGPDYCLSDNKFDYKRNRSLRSISSANFIEIPNLSLLFKGSFSCNDGNLVGFTIMFTIVGIGFVVFFFGLRIKTVFHYTPKR